MEEEGTDTRAAARAGGASPAATPPPPPSRGRHDGQLAAAAGRFPRSDASIAVALDQLDAELEEEESEERDAAAGRYDAPAAAAAAAAARFGGGNTAAAAAGDVASHRLDFRAQWPAIAVVTTASLPWLTGTAVNPALRAAHLWARGHAVALLVPWLPPGAQAAARLFPGGEVFPTPAAQRARLLADLAKRTPFPLPPAADCAPETGSQKFKVVFYAGRYDAALGSILPEEDIQPLVPRPVDLVVLEEPEHLTWYHAGRRWTRAFPPGVPVVGVLHTNYVDYVKVGAGVGGWVVGVGVGVVGVGVGVGGGRLWCYGCII
jgi:digalactosyldiacylglycerol synthase